MELRYWPPIRALPCFWYGENKRGRVMQLPERIGGLSCSFTLGRALCTIEFFVIENACNRYVRIFPWRVALWIVNVQTNSHFICLVLRDICRQPMMSHLNARNPCQNHVIKALQEQCSLVFNPPTPVIKFARTKTTTIESCYALLLPLKIVGKFVSRTK